MGETTAEYGVGDATYRAAGSYEGITRLVDIFYDTMDSLPEATALRAMHSEDLTESRRKLVYFLSGWMGGPKLYRDHYGPITIPVAHRHLPIDRAGMDSWLQCMAIALAEMNYPDALCNYLMQKLSIPAESIRLMCEHQLGEGGGGHPSQSITDALG